MTYQSATSDRVTITRDTNSLRVEVVAQRSIAGIVLGFVVFLIWAFAFTPFWKPEFSSDESVFFSMLGYAVFFALWVFFGVGIIKLLAWSLFGREVLVLGPVAVTKRIAFAMFGKNWHYDPRKIRNVRPRDVPERESRNHSAGMRVLARSPLGERGDVAFDYGERTTYFGYYLEPAEADLIADTFREWLGRRARAAA